MMKINLEGKRFGRLTVLKESPKTSREIRWECVCDCGNNITVLRSSLTSKRTTSCGCLVIENCRTHNLCKTPEYRVWASMIQRCANKKNNRYRDYGGRGIEVCSRWHKFENFINDIGLRPTNGHSIDRVNNNGNYEPDNCKWSTRSEQQCNKRTSQTKKTKSKRFYNPQKPVGVEENNNRAKLTPTSANQLRDFYNLFPQKTLTEIGFVFGVGRETARKVVRGLSWK